jgi:hypothetical protein
MQPLSFVRLRLMGIPDLAVDSKRQADIVESDGFAPVHLKGNDE